MVPQYPKNKATKPELVDSAQATDAILQPTHSQQLPTPLEQTPVQFSGTANFISTTNISQLLFRIGLASIFLVNSLYAILRPQEFTALLYANPLTNALGFTDIMVKVAMVNDLLLGVLILCGWCKKIVFAWAGLWLLIVAGIKLINLLFT